MLKTVPYDIHKFIWMLLNVQTTEPSFGKILGTGTMFYS